MTDTTGSFSFGYAGNIEGTDKIVAHYIPPALGTEFNTDSNPAFITWKGAPDLTIEKLFPPLIKVPFQVNEIPLEESTINIGTSPSPESKTKYYLSKDKIVDTYDYIIGERLVQPLAINESNEIKMGIQVPPLFEGYYFLLACADADNKIIELDEDNNCSTLIATVYFLVQPLDDNPPNCSNAKALPSALWPPNHKFKKIKITGVTDPDNEPLDILVESIYQDEPVNSLGDGDTSPDATFVPLQVRAERSGTSNGRVYHIKFVAFDPKGAKCNGEVSVCVPHDQGKGSICIDDGPLFNSTEEFP